MNSIDPSVKEHLLNRDPHLEFLFNNVVIDWGTIIKSVYVALIGAIVGQKIKYTQARTIRGNLFKRFGSNYGWQDLNEVIRVNGTDELHELGLSLTNISIITRVNEYLQDGNSLETIDDVRKLKCIKGIGDWTINTTILCAFPLELLDSERIFPCVDIFIRDRVKKLYNLSTRPSIKDMEKLSEKWLPYQGVVCWYFWRWFP